ncbi:MAG: LysM peptidoglycan-binding domain-containing protein [Gammaproteobacteria bacterium]
MNFCTWWGVLPGSGERAGGGSVPTIAFTLALALLAPTGAMAGSHGGASMAAADAGAQSGAPAALLKNGHPQRYIVRKGDTLWDIAGYFLNSPWRWKEIWESNPAISNPDLIYPGDILVLVHDANGRPHLQLTRGGRPTVKLSPNARARELTPPVPTVPLSHLRRFFDYARVVTAQDVEQSAYVVAMGEGRTLAGITGDVFYARGITDANQRRYEVYKDSQNYSDPITGEFLGREVIRVAGARLERIGDPATLEITKASRPVQVGSLVMAPDDRGDSWTFVPEPAPQGMTARIAALRDAVGYVGQYQVVVLNRGRADGLRSGLVFASQSAGDVIDDPVKSRSLETLPLENPDWAWEEDGFEKAAATTTQTLAQTLPPELKLPDEESGIMLVFRTFERVSYAVVMKALRGLKVGDRVTRPRDGGG